VRQKVAETSFHTILIKQMISINIKAVDLTC